MPKTVEITGKALTKSNEITDRIKKNMSVADDLKEAAP